MKKGFIVVLSCSFLLFAMAGSVLAKGQSSGKKAVKEYYDAWYAMDAEKAYDSLVQADKDEMTLEQFARTFGFNSFDERLVRSKTTYKIVSVKEKGDRPTAEIKFIVPDNSVLMERVDKVMASFKSSNVTEAQLEEALLKQLKKEKIPTLEMTTKVKLIKDEEGWHVFNDWITDKEVAKLVSIGGQAYEVGDLESARGYYEMALQLDPDSKTAAKGKETVKKMEDTLIFAREYIELENLKVKNEKVFGRLQTSVTFTVYNKSDKMLESLKVLISYQDAKGKPLYQVVHNGLFGFLGGGLKSGGRFNTDFSLYPQNLEDWRDKWDGSSVKVEIWSVKFRD